MMYKMVKEGCVLDASATMYPSVLKGFGRCDENFALPTSTYFGFVLNGKYELQRQGQHYMTLQGGMYFSAPGPLHIKGDGEIIVIERVGYRGLLHVGGPVEDSGRLCYIDNSNTTIIIPPPRMGDPVFNLLVFPPKVIQTPHIHPTIRLGVVFEGEGECVMPNQKLPLKPGMAFYLPEGLVHSFNSFDGKLKIIAFHPDSDTGPTDDSHPMLNRTFTKF